MPAKRFLPLVVLSETTKPAGAGGPHCQAMGCAGVQLDFPAQQIQGLAEVWVPFEEAIAIGWR